MNLGEESAWIDEDVCPCCNNSWSRERYEYPCPCKYQVCSFCYERIMKGDKKCPNCREQYDPAKKVCVEPPRKAAQKRDRPMLMSALRDEYEKLFGEDWDEQFVTSLDHPKSIPRNYLNSKGELLPPSRKDPNYQLYEGPIESPEEREKEREREKDTDGPQRQRLIKPLFLLENKVRFLPYAFKYIRRRNVKNFPKEDLKNVCILLWNLVYCVGVPVSLRRDQLIGPRFFGRYGHVREIIFGSESINNNAMTSTSLIPTQSTQTRTIYVTYENSEQAFLCIQSLNHTFIGGSNLKAKFAKTRFCRMFLEKGKCESSECKYLHSYDNLTPDQLFLKEEVSSRYFLDRAETRIPPSLMEIRESFETNKMQMNEFPPPITRAVDLYKHRKSTGCIAGCPECKSLLNGKQLMAYVNGQDSNGPYQQSYRSKCLASGQESGGLRTGQKQQPPGGYDLKPSLKPYERSRADSFNTSNAISAISQSQNGQNSQISSITSSNAPSRSSSTSLTTGQRSDKSDREKEQQQQSSSNMTPSMAAKIRSEQAERENAEIQKLIEEKQELEKRVKEEMLQEQQRKMTEKRVKLTEKQKQIREIREKNRTALEKYIVEKARKSYIYDIFGGVFQVPKDIVGTTVIESILSVFDVNVEQKSSFVDYDDFEEFANITDSSGTLLTAVSSALETAAADANNGLDEQDNNNNSSSSRLPLPLIPQQQDQDNRKQTPKDDNRKTKTITDRLIGMEPQDIEKMELPKLLMLNEQNTVKTIGNYLENNEPIRRKITDVLNIQNPCVCGFFLDKNNDTGAAQCQKNFTHGSLDNTSFLDETISSKDNSISVSEKKRDKKAKLVGQTASNNNGNGANSVADNKDKSDLSEVVSKILKTSSFVLGYSDFIPLPAAGAQDK